MFKHQEYDKMENTYTIWLCGYAKKDFITKFQYKATNIIGKHELKVRESLSTMVFVGVPNERNKRAEDLDNSHILIRLLGLIFNDKIGAREKIDRLTNDFKFNEAESFEEELNTMCNISDGIYEDGKQEGLKEGLKEGVTKGVEN